MIKETDGDYFEEMRSPEQDLTFLKIMEAYAGTGKEPGIETSDDAFKIIFQI